MAGEETRVDWKPLPIHQQHHLIPPGVVRQARAFLSLTVEGGREGEREGGREGVGGEERRREEAGKQMMKEKKDQGRRQEL